MPPTHSEAEYPIAWVDDLILELVPEFLQVRGEELAAIEGLLAAGDFGGIDSIGHRMKGSGGAFGFDAITDAGRALQTAAKSGDVDEIRRVRDAARHYLECVEVRPASTQ